MCVSGTDPERYDYKVFFTTFFSFLLLAQTIEQGTLEGPFDMVVNRAVCTLIGIGIVIAGDYFLFNSYSYARRSYFLKQIVVYDFLKNKLEEIDEYYRHNTTPFIYLAKLRRQVTATFKPYVDSAEGLKRDLKTNDDLKAEVEKFHDLTGELRRTLFALSYAKLVLNSKEGIAFHTNKYKDLLTDARKLIKIQ